MDVRRYWSNVGTVLTGATIAQAIPIVGSLAIARIYAPSEFGMYSTWLGLSIILSVLFTYRLEHAFGLEPDGVNRERLVIAALVLVFATALIFFLLSGLIISWKLEILSSIPTSLVLSLAPMGGGTAACLVWQSWAANNGDYKKLSYMRVTQTLSITTLQIGGGFIWADARTLAFAHLVGTIIAIVFSSFCLRFAAINKLNLHEIYNLVRNTLFKYRRFPFYSLPADLISSMSAQLPVFLLNLRFGAEITGYYALAMRTLGAPISILGNAMRDVFKREANEQLRELGHCKIVYKKTFFILLVFSILMVAVIVPFSENLFTWVFGSNWAYSGVIAAWLIPLFALRFIAGPLSYTFYVAQKQNLDLIWQVGFFLGTVLTLSLVSNSRLAIISYAVVGAISYLIYTLISYNCARVRS